MRTGTGLLLGFLAGLAAGFLLFRGDADPERNPRRTEPPHAAAHPGAGPAQATSDDAAAPRRRGPVVIRKTGGSVTTTGSLVIVDEGEIVPPRALEDLGAELARARAARDWDAYWKAVLELAALGTPEAQALLLEAMGDATLNLEGTWSGQTFYRALKDSDLAGILEAARARAEIEIAKNPESRWRGVGWLSLIALRGGAGELDWIEAQGEGRNWEMEVDRALAEGARNPLAAERLAARLAEPDHLLWSPYLEAFARESPRSAFDAAARALQGPRERQRDELWRLLGDSATEETLPAARAMVDRIQDERARLEALAVVERLSRRGLPVAGFEPIIDLPRRILAEYATRGIDPASRADTTRLREALNTLRGNSVAWNEETLVLVKGLADRVDSDLARFVQKTAEKMEAGLQGDDSGWDPERTPR